MTTSGLERFGTATISDCLDDMGITGVIIGLKPQVSSARRIAGPVYTASFVPITAPRPDRPGGTVGTPLQTVLQRMERGHVLIMDLGGSLEVAAWGNLASEIALRKGMLGTVINGCCRDLDELQGIGYPVFSLGASPRRSRNTLTLGGVQVPLEIQGVRFAPGDLVVGDETGVVIVPTDRASEVMRRAEEIRKTEDAVRERIEAGADLSRLWPSV